MVDATPLDKYHQKPDQNLRGQYWIRTIPATGCAKFELGGIPDERQGIIYYGNDTGKFPTTARKDISLACRDEPWDKLRPILPWTVEKPEKFDGKSWPNLDIKVVTTNKQKRARSCLR